RQKVKTSKRQNGERGRLARTAAGNVEMSKRRNVEAGSIGVSPVRNLEAKRQKVKTSKRQNGECGRLARTASSQRQSAGDRQGGSRPLGACPCRRPAAWALSAARIRPRECTRAAGYRACRCCAAGRAGVALPATRVFSMKNA